MRSDKKLWHWRDLHSLVSTASERDDKTDVEFWLQQIEEYMTRCDVCDEATMIKVVIGALKKEAKEWFGSLQSHECDKHDLSSIHHAILRRYSKSMM